MNVRLAVACLFLYATQCHAATTNSTCNIGDKHMISILSIPEKYKQLVLVTTETWESQNGILERYERSEGSWRKVGPNYAVVVGRGGLGWGLGLHLQVSSLPQKVEGDGRAPAGAFLLGPAFGYCEHPPSGTKMSYRQATPTDYFVDDTSSSDYNAWVQLPQEANAPARRWGSFEAIKRDDGLYKLGIVVQQNVSPVVKGRGSAVFLHIWRAQDFRTSGCTAMSEQNIQDVITWLDPKLNLILVQSPRGELLKLKFGEK